MDPATWLGIATIGAIVMGPILALYAQRRLDIGREKRGRKLSVFRELMTTRGNKLSYRHVEALNAIQVEFVEGAKERRVVDAWKIYLDHLNSVPPDGTDLSAWSLRADELLTDLLYEMSQCLGYEFDKVTIKRGVYVPRGHGEFELEQTIIRKGLLEVITGKRGLPVTPLLAPGQETQASHDEGPKRPGQLSPPSPEGGERK